MKASFPRFAWECRLGASRPVAFLSEHFKRFATPALTDAKRLGVCSHAKRGNKKKGYTLMIL